jgi:hypothetical protein
VGINVPYSASGENLGGETVFIMIQGKIVKFSVVLSTMSLFYGDHKYDWIMTGVNVPDFVVWRMMLHLVLHSCQGLMIRGPVEIWKL